jgi:DNA polymerase III gamma/tau subunit
MNLYQKHRPQAFDDMLGSEAQIESLKKALSKKDRPHTYLFVGPPGCGKTTAARIAARELGAGELSIKEINSADNRGIDTARQIIDSMRYSATDGDAVVYIIDELHMTTKDWQNAMLKPLEDTPDHVYFFLCTTDPSKLIPALKTPCTEFRFEAMKPEYALKLVKIVNRKEGLGVDKEILEGIADNCDGSPRKALVMLEKISALEDADDQRKLLKAGIPDEEDAETIELCRVLLSAKGWQPVAEVIKKINIDDPEKVRYAVMGYMNSVLLGGKQNDRAALVLEYFSEPFYNSGKPGLTLAAYQAIFAS